MYRPIKNDDRCYAISALQFCLSSPTIKANLDKINSIEGLKKYYKFKSDELNKWINKTFDRGGKPVYTFADYFAPRLLKDLGSTVFTEAMKELAITNDFLHLTTNNQDFISLMISDIGQEILHSNIEPTNWMAGVYTDSGIHHAINFILEDGTIHILDGDLPISTISEWLMNHEFLRIEVYGRGAEHYLNKYFTVKHSTHAIQCYKTNKWVEMKEIVVNNDYVTKIVIGSLALIVIGLLILYKKKFSTIDPPNISSSSLSYSSEVPPPVIGA